MNRLTLNLSQYLVIAMIDWLKPREQTGMVGPDCISTIWMASARAGRHWRRGRRRLSLLGARVLAQLVAWQERRWQRHALRYLDDGMLKDIGISRADAEREAAKPFWRR